MPEDTVNGGGKWNLQPSCGGGNCYVSYLTDGVDDNYIWSLSGLAHYVTLTNTVGIPGGATIDSYVVWMRMATNATGGNDRVLPRIRSAQSANYCDGVNENIETTTFADSSQKFTLWPTGPATCTAGLLDVAHMDSLRLQFNDVIGDTLKMTECSVVVWYHEGGQIKGRRRHLLSAEGGYERFAQWCGLDPNWVERFTEPEWMWRKE